MKKEKKVTKAATAAAKTKRVSKPLTVAGLSAWNKWLALLHAVQGVAVLLLATHATFPVTTSYLAVDSLTSEAVGHPMLSLATRQLFGVNLAYLIAAFFFMSAIAHAWVAWRGRTAYESNLAKGINKARWVEYAISASTMIVAIGLLTGVSDISALLMMFVLTAVMNFMGLVMELWNQGKAKPTWLPYWIGSAAGIVPWVVLAIYMAGSGLYGGKVPTFVYFIYGSIFVSFGLFAVNMYRQYKKTGKWQNYLYGERMYMILSLVAKTALAWQVFAGVLRP